MELVDRCRQIDTAAARHRIHQDGCLERGVDWKALAIRFVGFRGKTPIQALDILPALVLA